VLFALGTVAVHCPGRQAAAAFGVSELGALLAAWRLTPDPAQEPDRTPGDVVGLFVLLSGMVVAALAVGLAIRSRRAQVAGLRERASALEQQRDQQAALAVARERSRIAREMHDIVTHNLSVMVALADGAVYAAEKSPERATAAMRQSAETGRAALADMRRFLGVLRADEPDALRHPQPGLGQLETLVQQVRAAGLPTELRLTGDQDAASAGAQLTAYRLVQESLTNTLKHTAPGARAFVSVHVTDRTLELDIRDDGRALPRPPGHVGQGLGGMRERAAAYGGRLTAGPQPLGGWRVAAVLDLKDPEAREKESA
jgi:signal transduction histidine kinase